MHIYGYMVVLHQHLNKQILIYIYLYVIYIYIYLSLSQISLYQTLDVGRQVKTLSGSAEIQDLPSLQLISFVEEVPSLDPHLLNDGFQVVAKKLHVGFMVFGHAFYWFTEIDSRVHCDATNITGGSSWRQWHIHVWKFTEFYWIKFD